MRARYYDPSVGRFISEDPARDGTNWYTYCNSNPASFVDPNGKAISGPWAAVTIVITTAIATYAGVAFGYLAWADAFHTNNPDWQPDVWSVLGFAPGSNIDTGIVATIVTAIAAYITGGKRGVSIKSLKFTGTVAAMAGFLAGEYAGMRAAQVEYFTSPEATNGNGIY